MTQGNYREEFPEFGDELDGLSIPAGLKDVSWHNDASPRFETVIRDGMQGVVWVDRIDPDDRDGDLPTRFYVQFIWVNDEPTDGAELKDELFTDSWDEVARFLGGLV